MIKDNNASPKLPAGSMLIQKTNEDYNKKKPDLKDPNEEIGHPDTLISDLGDDDIKPWKGERPDVEKGQRKPPNEIEGSE